MQRKTNAQIKNNLIQSGHDCSDIISSNSDIFCPDGHRFCRICVRCHIQTLITHQKKNDHVKCFNSDCKYQLDLEKISKMISNHDYNNLKAKVNKSNMDEFDSWMFFFIPICLIFIFYIFFDLIKYKRFF